MPKHAPLNTSNCARALSTVLSTSPCGGSINETNTKATPIISAKAENISRIIIGRYPFSFHFHESLSCGGILPALLLCALFGRSHYRGFLATLCAHHSVTLNGFHVLDAALERSGHLALRGHNT